MKYFYCEVCRKPTNYENSEKVTKVTTESCLSLGSKEPEILLNYEAVLICQGCYDKIGEQRRKSNE